ncbi:unnamed protein product, partial [Effrenium voratum]
LPSPWGPERFVYTGCMRSDERSGYEVYPVPSEAGKLQRALDGRAVQVQPWDPTRFRPRQVLQLAPRNRGHVELLEDLQSQRLVVAKVMPISWTRTSHIEFVAAHPAETEMPWRDVCVTRYLSEELGNLHVCELVGLFRRPLAGSEGLGCGRAREEPGAEHLCMVMSHAGNDLFSWLGRTTARGREESARPMALQIFKITQKIHSCGVGHGDLSLENMLLASEEGALRFIDFGAATGRLARGLRGKSTFRAPEMYASSSYDAFLADIFSTGVAIFTLIVGNYPWKSTSPHSCQLFGYFKEHGLMAYLAGRRIRTRSQEVLPLSSVISPQLSSLLTGLLQVDPASRMSLQDALGHEWFHI